MVRAAEAVLTLGARTEPARRSRLALEFAACYTSPKVPARHCSPTVCDALELDPEEREPLAQRHVNGHAPLS